MSFTIERNSIGRLQIPKSQSSVDLDRRAFRRRKAFQFVVAKPQSLYLSRIAIATVNLSNYGVLEGEE